MPQIVPVSNTDALYQQVTTLDGVDFILTFAYNLRDGFWYLDVLDQDGNVIVPNVKIVVNWDLLQRSTDPRKPAGALMAYDTTAQELDPGLDDFGTRVQILYLTAEEVRANAG